MALNAKRILLMAVLAVLMQVAVAAARDLAAPSPVEVTSIVTNEDKTLQWLKITAVPLVVFLIGACTWSYIKNMALWRRLTGGGVESSIAPLDWTANSSPISNRNAPDLEVGLEISRRNMDEDLATAPAQDLTVQHPALDAPHDDGKCAIPKVALQL